MGYPPSVKDGDGMVCVQQADDMRPDDAGAATDIVDDDGPLRSTRTFREYIL
jgi:hypothetical protein